MRMPFGLIMSQDVFQQRMDIFLEQCSGTIGIADDVVVYVGDISEHDAHLNRIMQVALQEGLVFNSKKCEVVGTIYDSKGAHPDLDKISVIRDLSSPSTVVELQHILGIVTYLSPFIQSLANKTPNLWELLKKYTEYDWTQCHEVEFRTLKSVICNDSLYRVGNISHMLWMHTLQLKQITVLLS